MINSTKEIIIHFFFNSLRSEDTTSEYHQQHVEETKVIFVVAVVILSKQCGSKTKTLYSYTKCIFNCSKDSSASYTHLHT